jgi:hypothetical protein
MVGHLPGSRHAGVIDAVLNDGKETGVIDCVLESRPRQIGAFAARSPDAMARGALSFEKLLAASQIMRREVRGMRGRSLCYKR